MITPALGHERSGRISYLSADNNSGALLAGVTGMGVSAPVLHKLIGL
ncbi:hypothetical protein QFZ67_007662 [Streptomyces sp. V1I1]|nr:hypothetical protein [Streptomyces sp. V1I1]